MTAALFFGGAALFGYGLNGCYKNADRHRARIKARNDLVRETLRRKYGENYGEFGARRRR